jgi:dihydroxy-acid dehydratase
MPEAGLIPLPRKLAAQGVTDMLRISDGRMSGTAGGTIVLHVSPEAVLPGSVFGVVRDGDVVTCNVEERVLRLEISDEDIERRLAEQNEALTARNSVVEERKTRRGYRGLYQRCVNQAEEGADFDFLTAVGPNRA